MKESPYLIPVYKRVGPVFVKGRGSYLWDKKGRKYLDLFPGWGVSILGHCHPRILKVIDEQSKKLIHIPNNLRHPWQEALAKEIVKHSFDAKVFFANSGAEVVEGAIKFSRIYGRKRHRYEIITMKNSFHGRTFGSLSATGQKKYKDPFKPVLPGFKEAVFGDFGDFRRKVTKKTVGVFIEPIQGEGGVNIAPFEYLKSVWKFCKAYNLLFMVDEVQTGMGRTGKMFCYQHYGLTPDVMLLAKGLGAGVPIAAMAIRREIADLLQPGHHASTFGGNPLVTRVGLEVFRIIREERLLSHAKQMGAYVIKKLSLLQKKFKIVREIRAKGLMVGIELKSDSAPIFEEALRRKVILNSTHTNVLRIMPALNVTKEEIDAGVRVLGEVFKNI